MGLKLGILELKFIADFFIYIYIYIYTHTHCIIKVEFRSRGCAKWLHQIAIFFLKFLDLKKIYIYNFSSPIIYKLIKILI